MGAEILYRLGRWRALDPRSWLAVGIATAWTVAVAAGFGLTGALYVQANALVYLLLLAPALVIVVILGRQQRPRVNSLSGWMAIFIVALYTGIIVLVAPLVALAVPVLTISTVLARRYPAAFLVLALLATGFTGTSKAFLHLSLPPLADVFVGALWLGTIWSYLVEQQRRRTVAPLTGATLMAIYALLSFFQVFASDQGFVPAAQAFRGSTWHMMAFLLLMVAPLPRSTVRRAAIGFVAVAVAVGGYATFRWIAGQSGTELANAGLFSDNNVVNGRVRLIGSFVTGKELAAWTSVAIPFCLAVALALSGRKRLFALLACALCAVAMFGSDVRVGVVGVVPAVLVAFVLFQLAKAFPGAHLGTTLSVFFVTVLVGIGAFAYTLGGHSDSSNRYKILVTAPTQDASYQARLYKWRNALNDIQNHPLGEGLGSSGGAQQRYGRFVNISNAEIDNSYLKIAIEQGPAVMVFYIVALLLLIWGVARRAVQVPDPLDAGLAIGAVGVLIVFAVLLFAGTYIEGQTALTAWLFVGLGAAGVTRRTPEVATPIAAGDELPVGASTESEPPARRPESDPPPRRPPSGSAELVATAHALATDAVTQSVAERFVKAGIESILLKGPTLAQWLYDDGAVRTYSDIDLLVDPQRVPEAEARLKRMGFRPVDSSVLPETPHARPWQRNDDGAVVDLHWTLPGSCVSPQQTWCVLQSRTEFESIGGGTVRVLDRTAAALLVALHAAQHEHGKALADLERALERMPDSSWGPVRQLADELSAVYGLSHGLRMLPAGIRVADSLGLPGREALIASARPTQSLVLGFEQLSRRHGFGEKAKLVGRELVPDADFLRWRFPLARRGRVGLALAYLWRPGWLAWHALPSALAWRRIRSRRVDDIFDADGRSDQS